jgi:phage FluMu protein Com
MIEVRCSSCNKFLLEVSEDACGTIAITCPRCKNQKNPKAKRTIKLPFTADGREKAVALRDQPR